MWDARNTWSTSELRTISLRLVLPAHAAVATHSTAPRALQLHSEAPGPPHQFFRLCCGEKPRGQVTS